MTDVQSLGTSPKTTPSILSSNTAAESSIGGSSYSPAASQTALIPPPPHTAAPVIARDFSNNFFNRGRPAVVGAASTPAHPHHEEKLHIDNQHLHPEETTHGKHGHGHGHGSSSAAAKMVRSLSGNRSKEPVSSFSLFRFVTAMIADCLVSAGSLNRASPSARPPCPGANTRWPSLRVEHRPSSIRYQTSPIRRSQDILRTR